MNVLSFVWNYLRWHYSAALVDMYYISQNYLWGIGHIFSVSTLLHTLFVPWHRMGSHTTTFLESPADYLGDVFINIMMRVLGFSVRTILLTCALISATLVVIIFSVLFVGWIFLPIILSSLFINALSALLS